jgi:cysteine desulfurase
MVDPDDFGKAITKNTILITIMHANNEVGTVQPIAEIGKIARSREVLFHTDGIQTLGHIPVNVNELGVDFFSMSAHKFCGPKGVGACYLRRDSSFVPLLHGGGQERGLRSSTPNVPGVAGFSKALELAIAELDNQRQHLISLRRRLIDGLLGNISNMRVNGHQSESLPHILNVSFDGVNNDKLIEALDEEGIYVSKGAACGSAQVEPSHVLLAMGLSPEQALTSVRISLGRWNTQEEIDFVLDIFPGIIANLRKQNN